MMKACYASAINYGVRTRGSVCCQQLQAVAGLGEGWLLGGGLSRAWIRCQGRWWREESGLKVARTEDDNGAEEDGRFESKLGYDVDMPVPEIDVDMEAGEPKPMVEGGNVEDDLITLNPFLFFWANQVPKLSFDVFS
ncbi:hypothetical protein RIF29_15089 [Crotalaria pallida]|uniref:Uncharacterized protein n=1 Tax=Crotalaria pallida TaxID=3830 RepID=A0AAN9FCZ0_CROPI